MRSLARVLGASSSSRMSGGEKRRLTQHAKTNPREVEKQVPVVVAKRGHSMEESLREVAGGEAGETVVEICRKYGMSQMSLETPPE